MGKREEKGGKLFCAAALCAVLGAAGMLCLFETLPALDEGGFSVAAAGFILPDGALAAVREGELFWETDSSAPDAGSSSPAPASSALSDSSSSPLSSASSAQSEAEQMQEAVAAGLFPENGPVETVLENGINETTISNTGIQYGNVWVKNTNKYHDIDIAAELEKQPDVSLKRDGSVEILLYHTHTTEAFQGETRTQDNSRNVVAVGEKVAAELEAAGFGVVHDTTCHDYPSYNGSYDRSGETIQRNLEQYPGIQVAIDIHRDALGTSDARTKPTVMVNGRKAAQIMIVSGCDDDGTIGFPDWEYNLRLAVRCQQAVSDLYPSLARPLSFCPKKYNEHMTHGSILVEFGTDASTLDEVLYSGELFGKALVQTLLGLVEP
ncbi:MAG TPA: stage II sporulation protein P [Candidatus Caccousia avicola]|uniref:Stage II sporulation protein P n=1 Tax=Candidatus Caccousia avicola TaxID=2840721 RepID=A0A9D1AMB0_9FIRM|nr:stage II sporulation protein P [Candidatus Caccousia avicola]